MDTPLAFTIDGEVPTKKNMYRSNGSGGFFVPDSVKEWTEDIFYQLKASLHASDFKRMPLGGNLNLRAEFHIGREKDIDNMLGALFDGLQYAGVYENDRQIVSVIATKSKVARGETQRVDVEIWQDV